MGEREDHPTRVCADILARGNEGTLRPRPATGESGISRGSSTDS
jgi:hypothetical protein